MQLSFDDPEKLYWWLWATMGYFLWRYYQHYREEIPMGRVTEPYWTNIEERLRPIAERIIREQLKARHSVPDAARILNYPTVSKRSFLRYVFQFSGTFTVYDKGVSTTETANEMVFAVTPITETIVAHIKAAVTQTLRSTRFTEYALPFVLPYFPIGYWLLNWL